MWKELKDELLLQQSGPFGCGLYAVANACNLPKFVTKERLKISKEHGNFIGQLSKWMQDDGNPFYIEALYYNHVGKKLPRTALKYHPEKSEHHNYLPILINVQFSEEGLRHIVGGKINNAGELFLYDSLNKHVVQTTLTTVNQKYFKVFGLFFFLGVETGDNVFI